MENNEIKTNQLILGAIIGDVLGSPYEFEKDIPRNLPLLNKECRFTDDTVMTVAVMEWLLNSVKDGEEALTVEALTDLFRKWGRKYYYAGYGGRFRKWLAADTYEPINSFGNGSAMRVSPVAWWFDNEEDVLKYAEISALPSHDHPEGIKGAKAIALAVFLARHRTPKHEIAQRITELTGYDLNRQLEDIRENYKFDATCQGSVPESIIAYLESRDLPTAILNAIWLNGDTDTMADMAAAIAEARHGTAVTPFAITDFVLRRLPIDMKKIIYDFSKQVLLRESQRY